MGSDARQSGQAGLLGRPGDELGRQRRTEEVSVEAEEVLNMAMDPSAMAGGAPPMAGDGGAPPGGGGPDPMALMAMAKLAKRKKRGKKGKGRKKK